MCYKLRKHEDSIGEFFLNNSRFKTLQLLMYYRLRKHEDSTGKISASLFSSGLTITVSHLPCSHLSQTFLRPQQPMIMTPLNGTL